LKTGDVLDRDAEGFFYFKGRTDDMFNSGGENVYPLEVENMLLRHPAVAEASVVGVPHAIKGEVPVALVVKAKARDVGEEELKHSASPTVPPMLILAGSTSSTSCRLTVRGRSTARLFSA
jgi:acyl-coenzyme A synthetase/AMP-(fatty) acid ligase